MPPSTAAAPFRSPSPMALGAILVAAVVLAYANVFTAPFLFDDLSAVVTNPTIQRLGTALTPPNDGTSVTGRPLVNLTFALDHAVSGLAPWSYHATNIAIHAAAALTLFGLVRRTLALRPSPLAAAAIPLAFGIALLWALHPLQTESVSLVSQRTESLCGFFYLLTLYCLARALPPGVGGVFSSAVAPAKVEHPDSAASNQSGYKTPPTQNHSRGWLAVSVLACVAGMAAKEVMVTAPLVVLLYDRTFVAGSFAAAWRQRRGYYGALAGSWLVLAWLVLGAGGTRGDAAGLGLGVSGWTYLLKQCEALVLYLKLSFWPHPLVIDYGGGTVASWQEVWWEGLLVLALLAGMAWALVRRPVLGFLGAWFFVILAPSSSVVPLVSQTMAEHRMYLPLAAVIALVVGAAWGRWGARALGGCLLLALVAGGLTFARNRIFQDELSLWSDTVAQRPENMRARNNLAIALADRGRFEEAVTHYQAALRLAPDNAEAHLNLCAALVQLGRPAEAVIHGEHAVRLRPDSADAHVNLGTALLRAGHQAEAISHFDRAVHLQPGATDVRSQLAAIHYDLGNRAAAAGDYEIAVSRYRLAVAADASHVAARTNLANALLMSGHTGEAIILYRQILERRPDDARVRENLARALELRR